MELGTHRRRRTLRRIEHGWDSQPRSLRFHHLLGRLLMISQPSERLVQAVGQGVYEKRSRLKGIILTLFSPGRLVAIFEFLDDLLLHLNDFFRSFAGPVAFYVTSEDQHGQ